MDTNTGKFTDAQLLYYFHHLTPENRAHFMAKLILLYKTQQSGDDLSCNI